MAAMGKLTVLAVMFVALWGRQASACDCKDGAPSLLLPRDGATGTPTNARVLVSADKVGLERFAGADVTRTPKLAIVAVKGGARPKVTVTAMLSEAWGTVYVVTPDKPLAANTKYKLVAPGKTAKDKPVDVGSFTTGKATDTKPPVFAGLTRFTAVVAYRAGSGDKCEGQPPFHELSWAYDAATDDGTDAKDLIRILYVQKKGEARAVKLIEPMDAATPVTAVDDNACSPFHQKMKVGDEVCAAMEVVDLAGNAAGASVEKCMAAKKL
jgi:hypothetical protein